MGISENLLIIARNLLVAYFLNGFVLFLTGWAFGLSRSNIYSISFIALILFVAGGYSSMCNLYLTGFRSALSRLPKIPLGIILLFLLLNFLFCLLPPAEYL